MSGYWIIPIVLGCLFILLLIFLLIMKKNRRVKTSPYEEALISLIDGDEEQALKNFQKTVLEDSDNVEAYIRLAELLRKRSDPSKALQIHRYLLARRGLAKTTINRILFQTARDYLVLKAYQKATDTLKRLLKSERQNEQYYKLLLLTYEKSSLWNDAIETFRKMAKLFNYQKERLFNFEVYAAYEAKKKGNKDWAVKVLKRVLKMKPDNIPALIYSGDIEYSNGNIEEATQLYKKIIELDTESAYIVFPRIMKAFFDKGEFQKMEETYKDVLERYPDDYKTTISLADYYLKMGRLNEAQELLKNGVESHPDSIEMCLLQLLTEMELAKNDSVAALRHIIDVYKKREIFRCKRCGSISKEFIIRCPECKEWETYKLEKGV
ncbi:MAG: tetratricopeptide repeat protein [Candidatus Cloacimonadota bacterium]|nr:MAG: tetratricopeptide repeat protein [Candidatus Cloacimonadota bacterium]